MNKPGKSFPRPLADVLHRTLNAAFAKQGFVSTELVTRWGEIVGAEIAAHSEPDKIQWPRPSDGEIPEPGVLVLRVEGPAAVEIQHLSGVVLERVNRFFRLEGGRQPSAAPSPASPARAGAATLRRCRGGGAHRGASLGHHGRKAARRPRPAGGGHQTVVSVRPWQAGRALPHSAFGNSELALVGSGDRHGRTPAQSHGYQRP